MPEREGGHRPKADTTTRVRTGDGFGLKRSDAVILLAVAICANSTVFSWIDGTMLHPIPGARDTGALVSLMRGEKNVIE